MNDSADQFDPANFRLPEDYVPGCLNVEEQSRQAGVRRYGKRPRFQFCQFPVSVLDALIEHRANWTVLAVLTALHELWFTHPNHHNPVELTSYNLRRFGLSRWQKWDALRVLEKAGQITIERKDRKNPQVTLNWLPLVK
jgi:hypothetical protein